MHYSGSCHCGAVKFEIETAGDEDHVDCVECNCSICAKTAYQHLIIAKSKFKLISGENNLTLYRWGTGVAKHYFCNICGIKSFYVPRSNPDGVDVNVRCLDPQPKTVNVEAFDGQNWEDNAYALAHLSKDNSTLS